MVLAAYRWAPFWRNKQVVVHSDNTVTVASLNKCTSRNKVIMKCLRSLFWLSAMYNFHLTSHFIPGVFNLAADSASRLHLPGYLEILQPFTCHSPLAMHMSSKTFMFLLGRFPEWSYKYSVPADHAAIDTGLHTRSVYGIG